MTMTSIESRISPTTHSLYVLDASLARTNEAESAFGSTGGGEDVTTRRAQPALPGNVRTTYGFSRAVLCVLRTMDTNRRGEQRGSREVGMVCLSPEMPLVVVGSVILFLVASGKEWHTLRVGTCDNHPRVDTTTRTGSDTQFSLL